MVCLDDRNAFYSAPWHLIDATLQRKKVPFTLIRLIRSYLHDRKLIVTPGVERAITCSVPQGSVIGPVLWNLTEYLLRCGPVIAGTPVAKTVAYADDIAVLGTGHISLVGRNDASNKQIDKLLPQRP